jgi:hypothetical protein
VTATTTTVVVGGKQTKKNFDATTAGKRAMRVMVKLARGETGEAGFEIQDSPEGREKGLILAIADSAGGV